METCLLVWQGVEWWKSHLENVAIDVEGDMSSVSGEAGPLAEKYLGKEEILDFIQIEQNGGISDYFLNETKPFYKRN